jgi:hypothetical protein
MSEFIRVEKLEGIAVVTIDRPPLNVMNKYSDIDSEGGSSLWEERFRYAKAKS